MMARMYYQLDKMEACVRKTEATDLEANREEIESDALREEVRKGEATMKTVKALKKGHGDRHLAIRRRGQPKKRTHSDGGSQKKLVAACRGMNHRAIPAQRKRHYCQRQGKDKAVPRTQKERTFGKRRQAKPEGINGIRNRGAGRQLILRKERTTGNGIRGRSRRQELRLGSVKALHEVLGQTLELEVVKRAVGFSSRLRKVIDWILWRG
jgi:hypothetical protein